MRLGSDGGVDWWLGVVAWGLPRIGKWIECKLTDDADINGDENEERASDDPCDCCGSWNYFDKTCRGCASCDGSQDSSCFRYNLTRVRVEVRGEILLRKLAHEDRHDSG